MVRDQPLPLKPRGCSALTAASTLVFRGVVHTEVNAVVLFCFIDKKIFQHVLPRLLGRTVLCRLCNESGGSEAWDPHAHEQACTHSFRAPRGHPTATLAASKGRRSVAQPSPGAALLGTARSWRGIVPFTHLAREGRMTVTIGRRELLAALGGAAAAWPLAARAQSVMPVIGFLRPSTRESAVHLLAAFRAGLKEIGFVEGQNVAIEYRWAERQEDRLREIAAELVRRQVAVIVTPGSTVTALAAKAETTTIPIVFSSGSDPVKAGLIASLNSPGGNVTGIYQLSNDLIGKRLELLHEVVPAVTIIALLVNPANAVAADSTTKEAQAAARSLGLEIKLFATSNNRDIDAAFIEI